MDIDFIKWMCEKAEGFEVHEYPACTHIRVPSCFKEHTIDLKNAFYEVNGVMKSHLLQRAIEGVNRDSSDRFISQTKTNVCCNRINYDYHKRFYFDKFDSIDTAKESALRYIFDKEREG